MLQNQPRDWHDTFGVRAGGSYWLNREFEFFGGSGFASNAVPDETLEPALPDWHGISLGLGGRLEIFENVHVAASYTQIFYVPSGQRRRKPAEPVPAALARSERRGRIQPTSGFRRRQHRHRILK